MCICVFILPASLLSIMVAKFLFTDLRFKIFADTEFRLKEVFTQNKQSLTSESHCIDCKDIGI